MKLKIIPPQIVNRVKNTFQNPFDLDRFLAFVRDLFNSIDEKKAFHARGYVPEKYKRVIKTYERLATYTDPQDRKIDILAVYIQRESSLEYARTTLRNFVADYLKTRGEKDAALVAFVPPDGEDWRFSLVKMEYRYDEKKKKIKEKFTPAKRYSFLVGKHEKTHTAQSRLSPLVADDERYPTLEKLEEAFSVERVTKEFFNKYRELFLETKEKLDELVVESPAIRQDFENKNIDTGDFTKKLLGQIVFLYFLQRKGWFGVKRGAAWGTGSKNFLRELFEKKHGGYKNFFNDVLEPLFYQALRYDRSSDDDYFSQFDCRIPFLNGGLFDPINNYDWVNTDIELPDELFSNGKETKEGDTGSGILDIFDRYNFTVKEDEPLEKEVAVDPEMLGKVFENLLEVRDRKSKGTYYTPREIVHYMCRQSLINYLATELEREVPRKDIETLVKFGEMGVEHDSTYVEKKAKNTEYNGKYSRPNLPKSTEKHAELIDEKLQKIRICDPAVGSGAFLVGMMQEVVRARNVLTPHIENKNERTMYSFKRHAIQNCLYGVDIDPGAVEICKLRLWLSLIVDEEDIKQIKPLPNLDYKIACGNSLLGFPYIPQGLERIEELKQEFFEETRPKIKKALRRDIDGAIKQLFSNTDKSLGYKVDFDFKIHFSEVFHKKSGFDVVIANPPYVNVNEMKNESEIYRKLFTTPFGSYDIYILFFEKSIEILKEKGVFTYITSNKYFIADYARKLREFIIENTRILTLLDLADCKRVFEHAFVSPAITILQKEKAKSYALELGLLKDEDIYELDNVQPSSLGVSELVSGENFVFDIRAGGGNKTILTKLLSGAVTLDTIADVRTGVMGFEYWEMDPFIGEGRRPGHIRIITNGQIDRYMFIFNRKLNLYKKVFRNPYLDIEKAPINENTKQLFLQKKIIIRGVARKLSAQFDNEGFGVLVAVHTAIPKNTEYSSLYLLALINSSLFNWYHIAKFYTARIPMGSLKYPISFLKQLPIKAVSINQQKPFIELVDKILAITKDNDFLQSPTKQSKVHDYEKQIDKLVYELYGLTAEEIKIVANAEREE